MDITDNTQPVYNPAQQRILDKLGAPKGDRPRFDRGLSDELRAGLEVRTKPLLDTIKSDAYRDDDVFLSKYRISQLLGCQRKFMADEAEPFRWNPAIARGTIIHKAVELSMNWPAEPSPQELVGEAMASLERDGRGIGEYLQVCSEAERAEMTGTSVTAVGQFLECFPPLKPVWRPSTESPIRAKLHKGLIVLQGKPDLTLGQPDGDIAGKVIIDFKTGNYSPTHREDLRFYALLESLRVLPPRMIATCYLDQGSIQTEDVTVEMLFSAVERVADAAKLYVELMSRAKEPSVSPGAPCRWCPVQHDCEEGTAFLNEQPHGDLDGW